MLPYQSQSQSQAQMKTGSGIMAQGTPGQSHSKAAKIMANNAQNARRSSSQGYSNSQQQNNNYSMTNTGSNFVQQNGSTTIDQPSPGCLVVKQYGQYSVAGNVGRTGQSKINQDSVFVSKVTGDGKALTTKDQLKASALKCDWFCAVADGHGANGHFVSQFIQQHMPRQYELEKRRLERQKQAKDLVTGLAAGRPTDDESSQPGSPTLQENQFGVETNDKRIRKALVTTYLQVQSKLEKQTGFDCNLSGSTLVGCY